LFGGIFMKNQLARAELDEMSPLSLDREIEGAFEELGMAAGRPGFGDPNILVGRYELPLKGPFKIIGLLGSLFVRGHSVKLAFPREQFYGGIDLTRRIDGKNSTLMLSRNYQGGVSEVLQRLLTEEQTISPGGENHNIGDYVGLMTGPNSAEELIRGQVEFALCGFVPVIPVLRKYLPKTTHLAFDNLSTKGV
jgi:hypothetical protein